MGLRRENFQPIEVEEVGDRELQITWQDRHESRFAYPYLRAKCRCASCIDEWTGESRLDPSISFDSIRSLGLQPVGNYGIRFNWSDGHSTGIYAFEYLRNICPCSSCAKG